MRPRAAHLGLARGRMHMPRPRMNTHTLMPRLLFIQGLSLAQHGSVDFIAERPRREGKKAEREGAKHMDARDGPARRTGTVSERSIFSDLMWRIPVFIGFTFNALLL